MLRLTTLLLLAACTGDPGTPSDTDKPADDTAPVGCDTVWYADADGDGFGDPTVSVVACEPPGQEVADNTDCDDSNPAAHPGADEDCVTPFDANCDGSILFEDADADGSAACEDCDDADATRKPGTAEFCDGVDQDCDGEIDEDPVNGTIWYADGDGDGSGDRATTTRDCDQPDGYTADFLDCDDENASVHPGVAEACNGIDDDCDGSVDDGAAEAVTWYTDADGDSYGAGSTAETGCDPPADVVFTSGDCDDSDASSNPGATEQCNDVDDNCDGVIDGSDAVDQPTWYPDDDGDGWGDSNRGAASCDAPRGWVTAGGDCDDTAADLSPGAPETCDGRDEDCDGETDERDALDAPTWYMDLDGDAHGDVTAATPACTAPSGFVATADDCDDDDARVSPDAEETCDGADNDCDTVTDEDDAVDAEIWFGDTDGDGFGDGTRSHVACAPPTGFVGNELDCDDSSPSVSPTASETCDGEDDDCDGVTDEPDAADATDWYADSDGDGHGDPASRAPGCTAPAGHVAAGEDCDDTDTRFHPGATEADCDDPNDYNCDGSVGSTDADGDGWAACEECDDSRVDVSPDALEACNGRDDNCDGATDEAGAVGSGTWYADTDSDGHGDAAVVDHSCELPSGYSTTSDDCDDTRADVNPDAVEVCATPYDDDCDGDAAEHNTSDCDRWYLDFDEDGHGSTSSICACDAEDRYTATDRDDCDDGDPDVSPTSAEVPGNGVDDNCDDALDGLFVDDVWATFHGDDSDDAAGSSVAGGADVDGDGHDDVLIGAPGDDLVDSDAGMAFIVLAPTVGDVSSDAADVRLIGEAADDEAGTSVALGDIDGDGYAEALVGAPGSGAGGRGSGVAYLLQGPLASADLGTAGLLLAGAAANEAAGTEVCLPGDVDGDGVGDLLIGAPTANTRYARVGQAHLVLGGATGTASLSAAEATIQGEATNDAVGHTLASAGDVDGDGAADFWLGVSAEDTAGTNSGAAYLILGPPSGLLTLGAAAASVLLGEASGDSAGEAVAGVGDVDGDGHPDVLVGAPYARGSGAAYLVRGPFTAASLSLSVADAIVEGDPDDLVGTAVTSPGDVDRDGAPDLLIGAPGDAENGTDAGASWLFVATTSGTLTSADAWLSFQGVAADELGRTLAPVGDWDGDGVPDVLLGAPGSTQDRNTGAGAAYLFAIP